MTRSAVVIGSGPNGLVAAIELAKAGLEVEVREAADEAGGGVRSAELTLPGFVHDVCSAIHPLAVASPALRDLDVEWVHPDAPAAHPLDDGTAVMLERSLEATAGPLGADARAYRTLVGPILGAWEDFAALRFLRALRGVGPAAVWASLAAAKQLAERRFRSERARAFLAGHAAHSMLPLERRPSAGFALALVAMGHAVGWPFPRGGAGKLAEALVARLRALGGEVLTGAAADELPRADLVVADISPRELLRIAAGRLPPRYARSLALYRHGPGAFKVDWALREPIPWAAPEAGRAGTVHLGGSLDEIAASERAPWNRRPAARPFVLLAQQGRFDPTRGQTAWAYCHVPNGSAEDMTDRIEAQVERFAPGFRDLILARSVMGPAELEARNRNLVGGDLNNGVMDLAQLLSRPAARLVPWRTPVEGLYLCSAATPPGGGVHGLCGYFAANAALRRFEQHGGFVHVPVGRPKPARKKGVSMTQLDEQLVKYLADAHSIEEQALQQLRSAPDIADDPQLSELFRQHLVETEGHERMVRERMEAHGEGPSRFKDLLMRVGGAGFLLFARSQPDTPGKLVAHAFSYEHMELAAYELLARVAQRAGDEGTVQTAKRIRDEEQAMAGRLAGSFDRAVEASLRTLDPDDLDEQLRKYLADAHAIEAQAIQLLEKAPDLAEHPELQRLFEEHLAETREHQRLVSERLDSKGGDPSTLKDTAMRAGALNWGMFFQLHPDTPGKLVCFSYAFEHLEIAGYEELKRVAERAGDQDTMTLCDRIMVEERAAAEKLAGQFDRAVEVSLEAVGVS